MKIVIDDKIPFIKGALEDVADVVYLPGSKIGPDDVKDADGLIIRTRTKCNPALLEGSVVKMIATATIGYDHIDTEYCESRGIKWTNAPGCNSSSVEQYIVSVLLHISERDRIEPSSKTIGIIGVGNVGKKVKRACEALGFKVLCNDPPRERKEGQEEFVDLDDLLNNADFITMHVPLSRDGHDKTWEMADKDFFSKMKKGSYFINSSRGEVVKESALKDALWEDIVEGAVLDVFQNEPNIDLEFLEMLTFATPHIAGYSTDGKVNGTEMSVQALSRHFKLGFDHWNAKDVPVPENPVLFFDGSEEDSLSTIAELYRQCYDVTIDHENLRSAKDKFETLRGDYRIRREPSAYNVRLYNDDGKYRNIFEKLGFSVIGDSCF